MDGTASSERRGLGENNLKSKSRKRDCSGPREAGIAMSSQ
jgi:hypothetical protein